MPGPEPVEALLVGEELVDQVEELLLRNVHSAFVDAGVVTSQVFTTNSGDNGKISVIRGSLVSSAQAVLDYAAAGRDTVGCLAVTVGEVNAEAAAVIDDSMLNAGSVPDGHAYADFRPTGPSRSQARRLKNQAVARGWQHRT